MSTPQAWLEFPSGERLFIQEIFTIGRTPGNHAVIPSERVSRKHAVIRRDPEGAFELMDMGSSNGTYVNGQRISRPTRLSNGCIIEIGLQKITFRLPPVIGEAAAAAEELREPCWLLAIEAALLGARAPSHEELAKTIEGWSERCERIISKHRGAVVRSGNDGILAYWRAGGGDQVAAAVVNALRAVRSVQTQREEFRFALHYGEVALRRGSAGEWKPSGSELIFALQMPRLVRTFGISLLITEEAHVRLPDAFPLRQLTTEEMRSYRGSQKFYTLREDKSAA